VTAAPDFVLGALYVAALVDRSLLGEAVVTGLARAIPIEFAVIHASGFLAVPWVARWTGVRKRYYALGLVAAYSLVLAVLSLAIGGWWPLVIFWGLMLNRTLAVIVGDLPEDGAFTEWTMAWAGTTTLFVLAVGVGAIGATALATRALVAGFVYFTLVGLSELTGWGWVRRWMHNARRRSGRA
jgi:hypothetical protein